MTLEEIIKDKASRLDTVPSEFNTRVGKAQKEIFNEILALLDKLEKVDGQIVISAKNLKLIDTILDDLNKVLDNSEYIEAVRDFAGEFDSQSVLTQDYFDKVFDTTDFNALQTSVLKSKKKEAIELLLSGLDSELQIPIRQVLTNAVTSGATLKDTIASIRQLAEGGNGKLGVLDRYSKQIAYDSFAQSDRAYMNAVSNDIGAEWYRYIGGLMEDSREFCVSRNNKYFHKKEVEAWGNLKQWDGKAAGTDPSTIFIVAGGYNCNHSINPVSIFSVPQDVIDRNIKNGNYTPPKK